jgi:hypothetical protein
MATQHKVDWSECPLVKVKPEVQSGASVLRGIAEQFELPPDRVQASCPTHKATALLILFDKNVPVGVRRFLPSRNYTTGDAPFPADNAFSTQRPLLKPPYNRWES